MKILYFYTIWFEKARKGCFLPTGSGSIALSIPFSLGLGTVSYRSLVLSPPVPGCPRWWLGGGPWRPGGTPWSAHPPPAVGPAHPPSVTGYGPVGRGDQHCFNLWNDLAPEPEAVPRIRIISFIFLILIVLLLGNIDKHIEHVEYIIITLMVEE